ncbi:hypothetical protein, partial [Salmonella sp. s55004]|uniref:hypothetical protein n=1 Tax=Salmonella sp. s55004 TaxID=3159675 RepID=UPI00397F940E
AYGHPHDEEEEDHDEDHDHAEYTANDVTITAIRLNRLHIVFDAKDEHFVSVVIEYNTIRLPATQVGSNHHLWEAFYNRYISPCYLNIPISVYGTYTEGGIKYHQLETTKPVPGDDCSK